MTALKPCIDTCKLLQVGVSYHLDLTRHLLHANNLRLRRGISLLFHVTDTDYVVTVVNFPIHVRLSTSEEFHVYPY